MVTHRASSGDRRGPFKNNDLAAYLEQRMCAGCASYAATNNNDSHDVAHCTQLSLLRASPGALEFGEVGQNLPGHLYSRVETLFELDSACAWCA